MRRPGRVEAVAALLLAACAVTPLTNKIEPGQEPFLIAIGEGRDGQTDLFAANPAGGAFVRLTFSRPRERMARLSPSGTAVAFLRDRSAQDTVHLELVVLDLLTAGERRTPVPDDAVPAALGWSADGSRLYLSAGTTLVAIAAPPAPLTLEAVSPADPAQAAAAWPLLGDPPFAIGTSCGGRVCLVTFAGDTTLLDPDVREVFRWGADSVGLLRDSGIAIRPLGGGRVRQPQWADAPAGLRSPTHHPGPPAGRSPR